MSTFSGLNTALAGLNAARTGLNTVGQNLTNVNTAGYTRQRVDFTAIGAPARGALSDLGVKTGQGVGVTGIARLGDAFLDARVRAAFSTSGYANVRADALTGIESSLNEPGANGLSSQLQGFWAGWQDLANNPGATAQSAVLLQKSATLLHAIADGYRALDSQWSQTRGKAESLAGELNATAVQVASLNDHIRAAGAAGLPANELIDQRNALTARIAELAGGTVRDLPDGTNEILVGGSALVSGNQASTMKLASVPVRMGDGGAVTLEWARRPGISIDLDGGQLAGALSVLAPAAADGTGGAIAQAAAAYDSLAVKLAGVVNGQHVAGVTADGTTGLSFFSFSPGVPPAMGLTVVPTGASGIAAGAPSAGGKDGSVADAISQLGNGPASPDTLWTNTVVRLGVDIKAGLQQAAMADATLNNAVAGQRSNASVDIDEENVNLLSYQHAYQAAARVMTAIDEALDVLINQTGRVGR
ncbi:flagellar hook-associated protein FlgK [Specibacter sp. RAF43]|uniref:flagellar hook-associated protein FlgK n=1 Tax=Specibacter sp. RAF43 TaxID=3233057 RepID=UPI003F9AB33F